MSIYVYECSSCGRRVGLSDTTVDSAEETKCPECGEGNLKLLYSLRTDEHSDNSSTGCST